MEVFLRVLLNRLRLLVVFHVVPVLHVMLLLVVVVVVLSRVHRRAGRQQGEAGEGGGVGGDGPVPAQAGRGLEGIVVARGAVGQPPRDRGEGGRDGGRGGRVEGAGVAVVVLLQVGQGAGDPLLRVLEVPQGRGAHPGLLLLLLGVHEAVVVHVLHLVVHAVVVVVVWTVHAAVVVGMLLEQLAVDEGGAGVGVLFRWRGAGQVGGVGAGGVVVHGRGLVAGHGPGEGEVAVDGGLEVDGGVGVGVAPHARVEGGAHVRVVVEPRGLRGGGGVEGRGGGGLGGDGRGLDGELHARHCRRPYSSSSPLHQLPDVSSVGQTGAKLPLGGDLTGVSSHMCLQVSFLGECFSAKCTWKTVVFVVR